MGLRTAIITGASRGIGAAIAREFAARGYHLLLSCRQEIERLEALKEELESAYPITCVTFQGDMGNPTDVDHMFALFVEYFPHLSVLINNAGISHLGLLSDMTADQWQNLLNTNLSSVFYNCKAAIPLMLPKKRGKIINISSVWGICGASCEAAYSATKGGVDALTKSLGKELAPSNIQVNAIACGIIDTQMNNSFSSEEKENLAGEVPSGRFGTPQEVARLAADLCNGHEYLTGQIIVMDGGWI